MLQAALRTVAQAVFQTVLRTVVQAVFQAALRTVVEGDASDCAIGGSSDDDTDEVFLSFIADALE